MANTLALSSDLCFLISWFLSPSRVTETGTNFKLSFSGYLILHRYMLAGNVLPVLCLVILPPLQIIGSYFADKMYIFAKSDSTHVKKEGIHLTFTLSYS